MPLPRKKTVNTENIDTEIPKEIAEVSKIIDKDGFITVGKRVKHISGGPTMSILGFYNNSDNSNPTTLSLHQIYLYKKVFINVYGKDAIELEFSESGENFNDLIYFFSEKNDKVTSRYNRTHKNRDLYVILEFWDDASKSIKHTMSQIDQLELAD